MPLPKTLRRSALALLAGGSVLAAGCSADPAAEEAPKGEVIADAPAAAGPAETGTPAAPPAATPEPAAAPRLAVEGEGLRWFLAPSGSARPIPFGRPAKEVLASLEGVRGPATMGVNRDCGAGPVQVATWPDGLSIILQDDRFAGWGLGKRAGSEVATAAGIRPGSTRAQLEAAYSAAVTRTSLGTEFSAGDLHGILDGPTEAARITDMWAGVNCAAR